MKFAAALAALAVGLVSGTAAAALVAERITESNVVERQIGGPDAIGGLGDWYLANDLVEVIVDDPGRRYATLSHGGTLVDAGVRGRDGDDQFARLFPIVNLDQRVFVNYDSMRAEVDPEGGFARLVVSSSRGLDSVSRPGLLSGVLVPESDEIAGVYAETEYLVRPGEPFVHVTTRLRNEADQPARVFSYGEVWMRGGRSMRSFVGDTLSLERSSGFHHKNFDRKDIIGSGEAMPPATFVAMSGVTGFPPITYALFSPERVERGLRSFGVAGRHVNLFNAFSFDPPWQELGVWRLLQATREELEPGEEWVYRRRLLIVEGDDIAAATDRIFPLLGLSDGSSGVSLQVEPRGQRAAVLVQRAADAAPVTQLSTSSSAAPARAVLPPGDYQLSVRSEHREPQQLSVRVEPGSFSKVSVTLPETGWLRFGRAFADAGAGRVVVEGLGDTPDPVFGAELLDFRVDGKPPGSATETRDLYFLGGPRDAQRVPIPPGRYRLTATRGPTHSIAQLELEVPGPGAEVRVPSFELRRVVALEGVVSADFHVHAQASDDSQVANAARLTAFAAEGIDVMVSTDHDHVGDFSEALEALDLADRIRVRTGVEVTSSAPSHAAPWSAGHHNAWPVEFRPELHRQGAPPSQELSVAEIYALLRREYGVRVVQLNHALAGDREVDQGDYLSHLGTAGEPYDPARPIDARGNRLLLEPASDGRTRAVDFDAMEIMNGRSFEQYLVLREVWYSLLRQGFRRAATGNSDTHDLHEEAGYPRNYVYVGSEAGSDEDFDLVFDEAVKEGRSFATTGPLLAAFRVNEGRMGDLVQAENGEANVTLAVAAAPWVPVDEVRLLVNGQIERVYRDLADPDETVRLSRSESLVLARDAFVTVEAGAPLDAEPARWHAERGGVYASTLAKGFVSQAVSNPIYVDVDGNGRFDPPGLGEAGAATRRLLWAALLIAGLALVWFVQRRRAGLGSPLRPAS